MSVTDTDEGPVRRLIASVSGLLATVIGMGRTRLELFSVEVREEINRTVGMLLWGIVALLAASGGLLFAGLAVIFAFWETHRLLAALLVTATWLALALGAAVLLWTRLRAQPLFLQTTLTELARDEDELRGPGS